MAIPFNVPSEEHAEAALEQIIYQLIQILQRSRAQNQTPTTPRVCSTPRRVRDQPRETPNPDRMHDYVLSYALDPRNADVDASLPRISARTDLDWLSALPSTLSARAAHLGANIAGQQNRPSRRQRSSSESSCCEESKYVAGLDGDDVESTHQDWTQDEEDGETSRSKESCRQESKSSSLLSKLVPTPIQSSIWTAVICVVGWHLFRAR